MNFRLKGPVYIGETITYSWLITTIDQKGLAKASVTITKGNGVKAIEEEISCIVPGLEEREVLSKMLSEDDPTNGPTDTQQGPTAKPKHNNLINLDQQFRCSSLPACYAER